MRLKRRLFSRRRRLTAHWKTPSERRFVFHDTLEIGRLDPGRPGVPGQLLVEDPTVSSRHCVLTQHPNGRCTVRDLSRNGTKLDGRRLVPNVETEVRAGQAIEVAPRGLEQTGHQRGQQRAQL